MIEVNAYDKNTTFEQYDYFLETYDDLKSLKGVFLPKIVGDWQIIIVDPSLKDTKLVLEDQEIPAFVNVKLYVAKNKINQVLETYPEYAHKELNNYEKFKEFISTLKHSISNAAVNYAYKAAHGNLEELKTSLTHLDENCQSLIIDVKDLQSEFSYTKRVYTSQVLQDFLTHARYRYQHYVTWLNELGMSYAYNSMYKTIKAYMKDKVTYMNGGNVRNRIIERVDGVTLTVLYTLFFNSTHYTQLESILYQFDNITNERFRRYIDARLQ